MDPQRFDALARDLATRGSRRRFVAALMAGTLGFLRLDRGDARTCSGPDTICRENATCCSGICGQRDASGRRRCVCAAPTVACDGACVDPATAYQSDPRNCGACDRRCPSGQCQKPICTNGVCGLAPNPSATGRPCDDGNLCTVNDVCRGDGTCLGSTVTCQPLNQCYSATCDNAMGNCVQTALTGPACSTGDPCQTGETCTDGVCGGGTPIDCSYLNGQCTEGYCAGGTCLSRPANIGGGCDDGNACRESTTCQADGTCGGGIAAADRTSCPGGLCCSGSCQAGNCCGNADCTPPTTCGGGGVAFVCGCTPNCAGKACGADDGCGGICQTGSCPTCQSCVAGVCLNADSDNRCATTCCDGECCPVSGHVCGNLYQAGVGCCFPNGTPNVCTADNYVTVCCAGAGGVGCSIEPIPNICTAVD